MAGDPDVDVIMGEHKRHTAILIRC
jgi:hypothetical protein